MFLLSKSTIEKEGCNIRLCAVQKEKAATTRFTINTEYCSHLATNLNISDSATYFIILSVSVSVTFGFTNGPYLYYPLQQAHLNFIRFSFVYLDQYLVLQTPNSRALICHKNSFSFLTRLSRNVIGVTVFPMHRKL